MKKSELPAPCRRCIRVKDTRNCNNAQCAAWRAWFAESWEHIRAYPRAQMDSPNAKPLGVSVGGRFYLHPDQLRAYCKNDPCEDCTSPGDLCKTPCRAKKIWMQVRKENGYELEK